jgi:tail assembly chaperone
MWAAAVVDLGLAPHTFWDLTPAEFEWLFEKHLAREDREDRRCALIAAYIANFAGKTRKEGAPALSVDDILGQKTPAPKDELARFRRQVEEATPERYLERLRVADPLAEITMTRALAETFPAGVGYWSKLGTREGLMQPLVVAKVMAGWRPD